MTGIIREVTIGNCRLIQGDCLEVMPTLGKVDAVVTDPPYGSDPNNRGYGRAGRKIENDMNTDVLKNAIDLALSIMPHGIASVFHSPRLLPKTFSNEMSDAYYGEIIWDKKAPGLGGALRYQHENIAIFSTGEAVLKKNVFSVLRYPRAGKVHPHEKPLGLVCQLLEVTGGETILDPFMGSGTTGVACVNLDRKFIGIELDPDYFDIACERIREAYHQPRLELPEPPKAAEQDKLFDE